MSKRQAKVPFNKIPGFIGTQQLLSFIMKNSSVILAEPILQKEDTLKVKNTKKKNMDLLLSEIEEIWVES